jgi:hypothetical protein
VVGNRHRPHRHLCCATRGGRPFQGLLTGRGRLRADLRGRRDPDHAGQHDDARGVRARRQARRDHGDARIRGRVHDPCARLTSPNPYLTKALRFGCTPVSGSRRLRPLPLRDWGAPTPMVVCDARLAGVSARGSGHVSQHVSSCPDREHESACVRRLVQPLKQQA